MATSAQTESTTLLERPESVATQIDDRLGSARLLIKIVELVAVATTLAVWTLAYALAFVIVDHWVMTLSPWMRWTALAGWLIGMAYLGWTRLIPLLTRRINPLYVARAIENDSPTLKNSLINYLLLRGERERIRASVYATLEQRAATDLDGVYKDTTVDASPAIRVACVLIAILILSAAYTVKFPRQTLQSVVRVAQPWSDAAPPTRVRIVSVEPGDASLHYGQRVSVSASVDGLRDSDRVSLRYSTEDRQVVDRELPMRYDEKKFAYVAELPPDDEGLRQNVSYQVVAGDAESARFLVRADAAPSMVIERVTYEFPAYSGLEKRVQLRQGDIRGLEGARVTIEATANRDIRNASLAWDPNKSSANANSLKMDVEGRSAKVSFPLALNPAGAAERDSYQLRFFDRDGNANPNPITHSIHVIRDLPPVVEILEPESRRVETPLDGVRSVVVRAIDPDFELTRLGVAGTLAESEVLQETRSQPVRGQVIEKFDIAPAKLGWNVGDEISFYAFAEDNRTTLQGEARPNVERTPTYVLVVTPPERIDEAEKKPGDSPKTPDDSPQDDPDQNAGQSSQDGDGQRDPENQKSDEGADSGEKPESGEKSGEQPDDGSKDGGQTGQQSGDENADEPRTKDGDSEQQGDRQPGDREGETSSGSDSQAGDGAEDKGRGSDDEAQPTDAGGSDGAGGQSGEEPSGDDVRDGQGEGQGTAADQPPNDSDAPRGGQNGVGENGTSADDSDGSEPTSPGSGQPDLENAQPNDGPLSDGEAVETIQEHIERSKGQRTGETKRSEDQSFPQDGERRNGEAGTDAGQRAPDGEQAPGDNASSETSPMSTGGDGPKPDSDGESETSGESKAADPSGDMGASGRTNENAADRTGDTPPDQGDPMESKRAADEAGTESSRAGDGSENASADGAKSGEPNETGDASRTESGAEGDAGEPGSGESTEPGPAENERPQAPREGTQGDPGDRSRSGGRNASAGAEGDGSIREVEDGAAANERYADEATDMVLDYLKNNPDDRELLDKLNWSEEDRRRFVERWSRLKESAKEGSEGARRLSDALEGLGIRRGDERTRRQSSANDAAGGLQQEGASPAALPPHLLERFNAFKRGRAKSDR